MTLAFHEAEMNFLSGDGEAGAVYVEGILSARELEVLSELALGITNREIADKFCISQATVKTHVLSIFGKLGVSSRMMAVQEGRKKRPDQIAVLIIRTISTSESTGICKENKPLLASFPTNQMAP